MKLSTQHSRWLRRGLMFLLVFYSAIRASRVSSYTDFEVYWHAGQTFADYLRGAGKEVLEQSVVAGSPYRYSPLWAWFLIPLTWLEKNTARVLWVTLQWGFYFLSYQKVKTHFALNEVQKWIVLFGTARFALDNSKINQVSSFVLYLLVLTACSPQLWKRASALAFSISIKLQPLGFVLILAVMKAWKELSAFALALLGVLALSFSFGTAAFDIWTKNIFAADSILSPKIVGNQSIYGFWLRYFETSTAQLLFAFNLMIVGGIAAWLWRRQQWSRDIGFALGLALLPVFGVLTWKNTYLTWLFPLALGAKICPRLCMALAAIFSLSGEGIWGGDINHFLLFNGFLPWMASLGILVLVYHFPAKSRL